MSNHKGTNATGHTNLQKQQSANSTTGGGGAAAVAAAASKKAMNAWEKELEGDTKPTLLQQYTEVLRKRDATEWLADAASQRQRKAKILKDQLKQQRLLRQRRLRQLNAKVDEMSRVLFPTGFIIYNIIFWVYYFVIVQYW